MRQAGTKIQSGLCGTEKTGRENDNRGGWSPIETSSTTVLKIYVLMQAEKFSLAHHRPQHPYPPWQQAIGWIERR